MTIREIIAYVHQEIDCVHSRSAPASLIRDWLAEDQRFALTGADERGSTACNTEDVILSWERKGRTEGRLHEVDGRKHDLPGLQ